MARLYVFLVVLFAQALALAQEPAPTLRKAFMKDPQGQMSIEQAAAAEFRPYEGNLGLGFQSGAVWSRVVVDPAPTSHGEPWRRLVVRVGPNYLERIELYVPGDGQWVRHLRGALTPEASRGCPDDMHCVVLDVPAAETTTLYVRVEHRGFLVTLVEVLTVDAVPDAVAQRIRGITISMVVALAMLALGLVLLFVDRSFLLLAYCCFQFTIVLFIASNAGLIAGAFPSIPVPVLNLFSGLIYVLRVAMTAFLAWAVLRPHRPSPWYFHGAKGMLALCVASLLLVLSGRMQGGLMMGLFAFSVLPFWQLFGALSARDLPTGQRRVLVAGTLVYITMLVLGLWRSFVDQPLVPTAGLVIKQIVDWRLNGFAIGFLFFWITMLERASQKRARARELEALRLEAVEARTRKAQLDERSALVDMLTHELKNPLATIRFALASLKPQVPPTRDALTRIHSIDVSARRMDDLIERVANLSKIERTAPTDSPPVIDAATFIQELHADMPPTQAWQIQVQPGATFRCDRQLLWVILENLMTNAAKYALPGHPICIDVTRDDGTALRAAPAAGELAPGPHTCLDISNQVDPSAVPDERSLFDRYYRHPGVQDRAGMGLGLSVVKTAVQKIGGEVAYRHDQGRVHFTLRVPA